MNAMLRRRLDRGLKTERKRSHFRRLQRYPRDVLAYYIAATCDPMFAPVRYTLLDAVAGVRRAHAFAKLTGDHSRLLKRGAAKKWLLPCGGGDGGSQTWQFNPAFARNRGAVDLYVCAVRLGRRIEKARKAAA